MHCQVATDLHKLPRDTFYILTPLSSPNPTPHCGGEFELVYLCFHMGCLGSSKSHSRRATGYCASWAGHHMMSPLNVRQTCLEFLVGHKFDDHSLHPSLEFCKRSKHTNNFYWVRYKIILLSGNYWEVESVSSTVSCGAVHMWTNTATFYCIRMDILVTH